MFLVNYVISVSNELNSKACQTHHIDYIAVYHRRKNKQKIEQKLFQYEIEYGNVNVDLGMKSYRISSISNELASCN